MKKIIAIFMAAMMTATAFAGCGGSESSNGSDNGGSTGEMKAVEGSVVDAAYFGDEGADGAAIKLKVWAPDAAVTLVKKQIEDFKKAYPDKTFEIEVVAQPESQASSGVINDADAAADVFGFASDQLNGMVEAGVISEVAFKDYVTQANSEDTVKAATVGDKLYAYPETNDNGYYLVYNTDYVTADDAKTFEGVLEACKKAKKDFIFDAGDGFYACTFAFTAGAKIDGLEEDGTQKFVEYDEDEAVKTLQAFARLIKKYDGTFKSLNVKNVASGFKNDTCAAGVDGSWDTQPNKEALGDKFGAAKLPTINVDGEDKQLVSMFGYKYIGVNAKTDFPASAQILAHYLAGEECQKQRVEELGWGPSNKKVQEDPVVTESQVLQAIKAQSENSCAQVNIAGTFWTPMGTLGNKLVAKECNPEDADAIKKLFQDTINGVRDEG